ncbi:hypothetical protein EYC84_004865 [Monilinia fructicola]|uniref:Uncharacterized protein n=1 Tax=Monilinia fructicola TaxID=38448 RepID=A0A5M9K2J5_MONFR|nr:hypothetical protein EYC84_004865 [Monilinia fructicola]
MEPLFEDTAAAVQPIVYRVRRHGNPHYVYRTVCLCRAERTGHITLIKRSQATLSSTKLLRRANHMAK